MVDSLEQTIRQIKNLKIQGATAVAKAEIKALKDYGLALDLEFRRNFILNIKKARKKLLAARPTEPLAKNGLDYIVLGLEKSLPADLKLTLKKKTDDFLELISANQTKIIQAGQKIIKNSENILTHCHSSTVEEILSAAYSFQKHFQVYNTETRPSLQGRITARNLSKKGLPVTMVVDAAAPFLISKFSGQELMMDKVIIGADALAEDGSIVNKIGSYSLALAAYQAKIPFYVAVSLLKLDPGAKQNFEIKIEKRKPDEIWPDAPTRIKIINFAFDLVPAQFISGLITEFGIIEPRQVRELVKKNYSFIAAKK